MKGMWKPPNEGSRQQGNAQRRTNRRWNKSRNVANNKLNSSTGTSSDHHEAEEKVRRGPCGDVESSMTDKDPLSILASSDPGKITSFYSFCLQLVKQRQKKSCFLSLINKINPVPLFLHILIIIF